MISAQKKLSPSSTTDRHSWASEMVFIDGEEYFSALLFEISLARKRVYIETYIFEFEQLGKKLLAALNNAAARGVDVRLLVDGVGSSEWISQRFSFEQELRFELKVYHPLPWQILPSLGATRGPSVGWIFKLFSYANSRNHRKMAILDDDVAFVGSMNVSDVHLHSVAGDYTWHDVGVRLQGAACETLVDAFLNAWSRAWRVGERATLRPSLNLRGSREKLSHPLIIRNDGRLLRYTALAQRLRMIRQAQRRVWIANAYFVPSGPVLRSLMHAASRGVDVRLLLPACSDVHFMPWVARAFYSTLIRHGVRLFEYQSRILHAKTMLIDDYATIGSANMNHRSLLHDYELDVIVKSEQTRTQLERMFEADFLTSHEVEVRKSMASPWWREMVVKFLLYFRHVL